MGCLAVSTVARRVPNRISACARSRGLSRAFTPAGSSSCSTVLSTFSAAQRRAIRWGPPCAARAGHPTTIPVPMTHCQRSSENPARPSLTIPVHGHGRQADGHERSRQPDSSPEGRLPYRDGSDALVGAAGLRIARSAETVLEAVGPTKEALRRRSPSARHSGVAAGASDAAVSSRTSPAPSRGGRFSR